MLGDAGVGELCVAAGVGEVCRPGSRLAQTAGGTDTNTAESEAFGEKSD